MKKLLILGVVAIMLSLGLVLAGCDLETCPGGSNPNLQAGYGVGSNKGGCNYSGTQSSLRDCESRCLQKYSERYPYATSFSCDC